MNIVKVFRKKVGRHIATGLMGIIDDMYLRFH